MGAGDLFVGASATVTDSLIVTNGPVGIGTASPAAELDINAASPQIKLSVSGTRVIDISHDGSNASFNVGTGQLTIAVETSGKVMRFDTVDNDFIFRNTGSSSERMRILGSSGNVGIATATPNSLFQIGNRGLGTFFNVDSSGNATTSGWFNIGTGSLTGLTMNAGDLFVGASATVTDSLIVTNGPVGIGVTAPEGKLHVQTGSVRAPHTSIDELVIETAGDGGINILTPSTDQGFIGFGDADDPYVAGIDYDHNADRLRLFSGNAGVLYIINGNVGIATNSPQFLFEIGNEGTGAYFSVDSSGNATTSGKFVVGTSNPAGPFGAGDLFVGASATVTDSLIVTNGPVGIGTDSPGNILDIVTGGTTSSGLHFGEAIDEGVYLLSVVDDQLSLSAGAEFVSNSWTARATEMSMIHFINGTIVFRGDSSLTDGNTFTPTDRVTITAAGLVGIGTASPSNELHILDGTADARITIEATTDAILEFRDGGGIQWFQWMDGNANNELIFYNASSANIFTLLQNGNVGVGDTSPLSLFTVGDG